MQQHRYPEAFRLYSQIVEAQPADADAMHARGGALLEAGLWPEAHAMFRDAAAQHPLHPGLLLHASKELAYQASETALEAETADAHAAGAAQREAIDVALPGSKELISGRAFVTHGPLQVLSDLECDEGLRLAEDAAALSGGWTTARHYAVVLVPSSSRLPPRSSLLAPRSSLLAPRSSLRSPPLFLCNVSSVGWLDWCGLTTDACAVHNACARTICARTICAMHIPACALKHVRVCTADNGPANTRAPEAASMVPQGAADALGPAARDAVRPRPSW
eukprot:Tamp_05918.p2 GENE.Tamp_05918~~Tamp_05918.p2  ORF type:complete len:277 (+),score=37.31 Tamp_05918:1278-2108(+)